MEKIIKLGSEKVKRRKKTIKITKIILLIIFLLLAIAYIVSSVIYNRGNFTITLDKNLYFDKNIIIYDNPDYKVFRTELYAESIESFDNITARWIPADIDSGNYLGSHNGENYVAYTFFVENFGDATSDYWSEIIIDDVVKNVDEAVRIEVYKDGEPTVYAKKSQLGTPENGTVAFESDTLVALNHNENFKPGDKIKYTIVVWLEGKDPECTDNILGGEIKIHMNFNSEFIEEK